MNIDIISPNLLIILFTFINQLIAIALNIHQTSTLPTNMASFASSDEVVDPELMAPDSDLLPCPAGGEVSEIISFLDHPSRYLLSYYMYKYCCKII